MKGEKGQALPLAMLALTIGALVIAPFLGHAGSSLIGSRTYANAIASRDAADAGVEHAIWSLTRGILATQLPNPGDHVTYQLGEALNGLTTSVTVTANATGGGGTEGNITDTVIDTLEFDTSNGYTPDIIRISDDVCAIAYRGSSKKGYVKTVSVAPDGTIGNSVIDTLNFETSNCYEPVITYVSGNYYAIAYRSSSNKGYLKTVSINSNGSIGNSVIDSLTFDSSACYTPSIIHVTGNYYAIAYRGASNHGYLKTVSINASGSIGNSVIDSLTFDSNACYEPVITYVSGNYYAIAYRGASNHGYLKTVSINSSGSIGNSVIDSLTFDSNACYTPSIIHVTGNYYAIAYRGASNHGYLKTVSINSSGSIGSSVVSTLLFDTATAYEPVIVQAAANIFAIAYRNSSNKGYLKTVSIASNGTINPAVIDTLYYEPSTCYEPSMVKVTDNVLAIAYRWAGSDGYVITVGISSGGTAAAYLITSTAGSTTISALVDTDNTTASIVSWQIQ